MSTVYFAHAGRAGGGDLEVRMPELAPMRQASIAVFGLGALGAPSAIEFARAGVRDMHVIDHDIVDPATIGRWPLGIAVAGLPKVEAIRAIVKQHYPYTRVHPHPRRLGGVRTDIAEPSEAAVIDKILEHVHLVFDATAEVGVQRFLSDKAAEKGLPYIGVDATYGAWGGRIVRIMPGKTAGCYCCYRAALESKDETEAIRQPPMNPKGEVQPLGCGDVTFVGAGFDLVQIALTGVRMAVSTLCAGEPGAYPPTDWDVMIIEWRNPNGELIPPRFLTHPLQRHPQCPVCSSK